MSRISWGAGALSVVFLLACMGGEVDVSPAPTPTTPAADEKEDGEDGEGKEDGEDGEDGEDAKDEDGDAAESWCCEYDGPLGKTQALIGSPEECTEQFGDNGAKFLQGAQCEPVCCKYAEDQADLSKGHKHEVLAKGNCDMRKGDAVTAEGDFCPDLQPESATENDKPAAKPKPVTPRGPLTRPGGGARTTNPRGGGGKGIRPAPKPGGLTRPGGR